MATARILSRSLLSKLILLSPSPTPSHLIRLRPLTSLISTSFPRPTKVPLSPSLELRGFATRTTSSSLNDPNPNWSNRPPKETILLDGCDFEHWLVVMEKPEGEPTRDEIIDSYVKTLAQVVGSEEEARMKLYSVSTKHYFAFGCLVSEELSYKIKELPKVRWVLPDSYLDVRNKDYGGEPVINGVPVPYDPKYHEEWVRNNARANERNRRNDRPRNFDRSRNFERRRENMQSRDAPPPNMGGPPQGNMGGPPQGNMGGPPQGNMGGPPQGHMGGPPQGHMGGPPQGHIGGPPQGHMGGPPQGHMGGPPQGHMGGPPQGNMGGPPQGNMGGPPQGNMGMPPQGNMGGPMPGNMGGPPQGNMGGVPPNMGRMPPPNRGGYQPNNPGGYQSNNMGGMPPSNGGGYQPNNMGGVPPNNTGGYPPNNMGGMPPNNMGGMPPNNMGNYQNREFSNNAAPYTSPSQSNRDFQNSGGMPGSGNTYKQ